MAVKKAQTSGRNSRRDPELTQREILDAAATEFALHGPRGARTEDIASRTNTSKRMIFYYFGSKEALYRAVLLENYRRIRSLEVHLGLEDLEPVEALRALVRATLDHYERNPSMALIVTMENVIMHGHTAETIESLQELNRSAPQTIESILERGQAAGVFRTDDRAPSALDVHEVLSAMVLNRVSNRRTFRSAFGRDMLGDEDSPHVRALIEDTIVRLVLADPRAIGTEDPSD